jgi:deazaflavin-dependent oxidoreductase (nitroreductase family)
MDEAVRDALQRDRTVDITTTGRRSGEPRRIEIWIHHLDGSHYISGLPGRRGWYANVLARPDLMLHLKEGTRADLPGRARPVTDPAERRALLTGLLAGIGRERDLEAWVTGSPIIEVELDEKG